MAIVYALLTIAFYVGLDFFLKKAAGKIDDFLGAIIINAVSILPALLVYLYLKFTSPEIYVSNEGLKYSVLAGLSIGIGTITFIKLFATGANLSVASPVVRIGIIVSVFLLGVFLLKESITSKQVLGLLLSIGGLALIMFGK